MKRISQSKKNNILIGGLLAVVVLMAVGYAAFSTSLKINGTASVSSNWDVHFVTQSNVAGTASYSSDVSVGTSNTPSGTVSASGTSATINTTLYQPGDSVTYTLTVENSGSIDAVVDEITFSGGKTNAITYTATGIEKGDTIYKSGSDSNTKEYTITVKYIDTVTKQPADADLSTTLTINMSFKQATSKAASKTGVETLLAKANDSSVTEYSSGTTTEMYTFSHAATEQTDELTDYRYIGKSPNNLIKFNNEDWRILGVFTVDGVQRIKIIKDTSIGNYYWDNTNNINEWTTASLNTYLNGDYKSSLSSTAQLQIEKATYYLGGASISENETGDWFYAAERGKTVSDSSSLNTSNYLAIMYASDYVYTYAAGVDSKCYSDSENCDESSGMENSWLYTGSGEWLLNPCSTISINAFLVNSGNVFSGGTAYFVGSSFAVRPTLYLKSDVTLSGSGTSSDPYTIS